MVALRLKRRWTWHTDVATIPGRHSPLHYELAQFLQESSGKRELLSHPKGLKRLTRRHLCTAVKAVLCKLHSFCSSIL